MDFRALSRRVGIAAAVATVIALVAPYAFVTGYATELAGYYASGAVGWGGIALFALLSAVVIASVEQGNLDPGTLAGVAVVLGVATTASAALWATAIEPFLLHKSYQLAAHMPDAARVDRQAFRAAFAQKMGAAGWWPTDSGRIPRLGGYVGNAVRVPVRGTQHLLDALRPSNDVQGSWPPFQWGWHDVQVDEHFPEEGQRLYQGLLEELMAEGPERKQFSEGEYIPARLRALTLAFRVKKSH